MRKSGIWDAFSYNKDGAEVQLADTHHKYQVAKQNAAVWQDKFMVSLAAARAERNKTSAEKELKLLQRVVDQKCTMLKVGMKVLSDNNCELLVLDKSDKKQGS
jgi:VIT1/CCC1 family predicted Fe2+/Mn2+ transporter